MGDVPNDGQLALLVLAGALLAAGVIVSLLRLRHASERLRIAAKALQWSGIVVALGVIVWHAVARGSWVPLEDNFDALMWLGTLLAIFVMYVQRTRPLGGLDWFVMPIVILLLVAAGVFGRAKPHEYVASAWSWVHIVSAYGGAVAFAVAGGVGAMYLIVSRRLRAKALPAGTEMGSLERLEHVAFVAVTLGFALLTVGLITGLVKVLYAGGNTRLGKDWMVSPKVLLAFGVWVVYALVLHSPINPSFRGRRAAMLSIVGLVLMIGTIVAVQFMPAMPMAGGSR